MTLVIFDPEAQAEFLASVKYYEDCQHGLGRRFRLVVESAIQNIAEAPFRYRVLRAPFRLHLLSIFPYSIIYSIEPEHIRIIAVAHNKRKPGYWLNRVPDMDDNSLK
ncbi:MAG: plasmid stabilization protein [Desulfobacteraceae bacterium 4572_187]|nr:MAG: plasmid stabilization protein [Desulfobacteraceae bacterium 4572_187]RLB80528.1 MAG: type II toxin-antitoxin system RelE/ParE family toxin [Deltaproteobacteria bacterium]